MSILNNIKWVGCGQGVKIISQLTAIFYLTGLITPSEYGLLAMSSVVINLANIFNDLGTTSAVIQKQNASHEFYNSIYKINLLTGFFVMLAVFAVTPIMVEYFNHKELYFILALLALSFPISSLGVVHKALLEKKMNFSAVVKVEIIAATLGLFVAIVTANLDFGVYSLVAQALVSISVTTILLIAISTAKLKLTFENDFKYSKEVLGFSGHVLGFNLINYFSRNLDSLLIGRFFSASILGAYSVAYRIMLFPLQSLTFVISRVFLPHFSQNLKDVEKNRGDYLRSLKVILSISAPLMLGLAAISSDFVHLFFDKRWSLVGDLLIWLAPTAIIQSVLSTTGTVFIAYAKTRWLFYLGCLGALLMAISFLIGIFFEIKILVILYFIANIINFFPVMYLIGQTLGFSLAYILRLVLQYIVPAILMYVSIIAFNEVLPIDKLESRFVCDLVCGVLSYVAFFMLMNYKDMKRLFLFFKTRFRL